MGLGQGTHYFPLVGGKRRVARTRKKVKRLVRQSSSQRRNGFNLSGGETTYDDVRDGPLDPTIIRPGPPQSEIVDPDELVSPRLVEVCRD